MGTRTETQTRRSVHPPDCRRKEREAEEIRRWFASQPRPMRNDDPNREWTRIGNLEASFDGVRYVALRPTDPELRTWWKTYYLDKAAFDRILELFEADGVENLTTGLPHSLSSSPRGMDDNDPRRRWVDFGDLKASYDGVGFVTVRGSRFTWTCVGGDFEVNCGSNEITVRRRDPSSTNGRRIHLDRTAVERILGLFPDGYPG